MGVIGVNSHAELGNCSSASGNDISSIMLWAQEAGKSTGLITTTRITHATPAATYAHSPDRDWEADCDVPWENQKECMDIAKQLIEGAPGKNLKVYEDPHYSSPPFSSSTSFFRLFLVVVGKSLFQVRKMTPFPG
jgi:hypothetical protein